MLSEWIDDNGHLNVAYGVLAIDHAPDSYLGRRRVAPTPGSVLARRRHPQPFALAALLVHSPINPVAVRCKLSNSRTMIRNPHTNATFILWFLAIWIAAGPAAAACTDPPGPGVNWKRCAMDRLDLKGVDLKGAILRSGSFFRADLSGSNLAGAQAIRVKFVNATLVGANLDGARLYQADLTKADLTDASLVGTDLRLARLNSANLRGANLTDAKMKGADLNRVQLSGATWTDGKHVCAEGSVGRCN